MKVRFCGAARNVTGSAHLITLEDGYTILLDCGLFQGRGKHTWEWNNTWHFKPKEVDCVILSHAHIDHSGRLPKLVKDGFRGPIYSTHATRTLCNIMLLDSAKIQEIDVAYHNRKIKKKKKSKFRVPLYKSQHVHETMPLFVGYSYDTWFNIRDNIQVQFRDTGHILGSASVALKVKEGDKEISFGFTGDIGRPDRPILRDPKRMADLDYLICESTYGYKDHESTPEQSETLLEVIRHTCLEKKGKLIIPAFSVGRTQEIIYMMDKMATAGLLPKIPVYVDSPLAVNATIVFGSHPECFDDDLHEYMLIDDNPFGFNDLKYIRDVSESKALNDSSEPMIIVSSSGMMNAGRVKHHLYNNIENEKNTFLIVGYCSPETPGGQLRSGKETIKLFGDYKEVKAEIRIMDSFSAHADRNEMLDFISNQKGLKSIFLVHGEHERQEIFRTFLKENGYQNIEIPKVTQEYELT